MKKLARWQDENLPGNARFRDALRLDRSLDGTTKGVLMFLAEHWKTIRVSTETLALECGRSKKQVVRCLETARSQGWIKRSYYGGYGKGADEYELIIRGPGKSAKDSLSLNGDTQSQVVDSLSSSLGLSVPTTSKAKLANELARGRDQGLTPLSLPGGRSAGDAPGVEDEAEELNNFVNEFIEIHWGLDEGAGQFDSRDLAEARYRDILAQLYRLAKTGNYPVSINGESMEFNDAEVCLYGMVSKVDKGSVMPHTYLLGKFRDVVARDYSTWVELGLGYLREINALVVPALVWPKCRDCGTEGSRMDSFDYGGSGDDGTCVACIEKFRAA
jgi:hypothetical protein